MMITIETIAGRKVCVERNNWHRAGGLPEVIVSHPLTHKAIYEARGSSLYSGDDVADREYLESLCADKVEKIKPLTEKQEELLARREREHAEFMREIMEYE